MFTIAVDFQRLLNAMSAWCGVTGMLVSLGKSKVVTRRGGWEAPPPPHTHTHTHTHTHR
jgi:hypothetical protein